MLSYATRIGVRNYIMRIYRFILFIDYHQSKSIRHL